MLPTRIAFCITELDAGGAERMLTELVLGLPRPDWEPRVYSLGPSGPYATLLQEAGVPVRCFDGLHAWDAPRVLWQLKSALHEFRPALLQTFLFHANILGRLAGRWAGVPHIVSGIRVADRRSRLYGWIDRRTNWLVDRNVCVSRGVADYCERESGFEPAKTVVIPNGVDVSAFTAAKPADWTRLGLPADSRVALTIGRLEPQKGMDLLLASIAAVASRVPALHLVIVGDGPDRASLQAQARALGIESRVWFLGRRPNVPELLAASEVFVLASRWEGMPNVVLEAMAAGKPIVATAVEGTTELICDGVTGWLVPVGELDTLATALHEAFAVPGAARSRGVSAQHLVNEQFTIESMVARYAALYCALMGCHIETASRHQ